MKKLVIFFVLVMAMTSIASADIMLAINSGPVVNGGNFNWTYTATLVAGSTLNTSDFFTIYDIGGFGVGVPIAGNVIIPGAGWSSSIQATGINGFGQSPVDNGSINNLTFTFTGAPIVGTGQILGGGAGAFGYTSSNSTSFTGAYSATTHQTSGGAIAGNTSTVAVAGAAPVPEPSTTLLLGGGLLALSFLARRRGRV